jgi:hypothetical protein
MGTDELMSETGDLAAMLRANRRYETAKAGLAGTRETLAKAVRSARDAGWSWRQIGDVFGIASQTARERWGGE